MMKHLTSFAHFAERMIQGWMPDEEAYLSILRAPKNLFQDLLEGAEMLREHYFGKQIHLCTIINGKSGRCTEDCAFCSQSRSSKAEIPVYPLRSKHDLQRGAFHAHKAPVNRYAVVTSGKRLSRREVGRVAQAFSELKHTDVGYCASLGILDQEDFKILREAGVSRYHHNLETSESLFSRLCTTHAYEDRVKTIRGAKEAGFTVCAGGIFGVGETNEQVLELALALRELQVDAVPINFLLPVKGTQLEGAENLTPEHCLRIISLFRYVMPQKEIIICGGRETNLGRSHPLVFSAGASGIMTGDYLTTKGRSMGEDLRMLEALGLRVREKGPA